MSKNKTRPSKKNEDKIASIPRRSKKNDIYSVAVFIAVCALIFYPPYVRGLFFPEDMFIYHILTALVFLLIWIDKISRKDYDLLQTPMDWAVAAYAGAYLLSLIGAIHVGEAFYGFLKALNYFMVYWAVSQMVRSYRSYVNVLRILLTSGTGVAIIGILAATGYAKYPAAFDGRVIYSTLQYSNTTAAYLAVITLIAVTLWIREENRIIKLFYAVAAFLMMLVVLATLSKGAWLIFVLGALLFLLGMSGIYRIKSIYFLALSGGAALITAIKFLPAIAGKENHQALSFILLGIAIVLLGELIWEGIILAYRRWGSIATAVILVFMLAAVMFSGVIMVDTASIVGHELRATALIPELDNLNDLSNSSFTSRMDFYRWGVGIVKDYPVNGTGVGGWNALYHSYQEYLSWTTQVHNHFLQVWIEAGTIGMLAFLSMWLVMLWLLFKRYKEKMRQTKADNYQTVLDSWVLNWGTASAALAFGAHAAIDFDLSLGAMSILLWTLFALINSAGRIDQLSLLGPRFKPWVSISCGIILVIVMLVAGEHLTTAHNLDMAGKAMWADTLSLPNDSVKDGKLASIGKIYEQAANLDTLNAGYQANIAQANAMRYAILKPQQNPAAAECLNKAQQAIGRAEKYSPRDIKIRGSLLNSANLIGDYAGMVKQARSLVESNPNDIKAHEALIQTNSISAEYYLSIKQPTEAVRYLEEVLLLADNLEKRKQSIKPEQTNVWQGAPLLLSADRQLSVSKACYLLGEYKQALDILQPCMNGTAGPPPTAPDSKAWYLACLYRTGAQTEAQTVVSAVQTSEPQTVNLYNRLIKMQPLKNN